MDESTRMSFFFFSKENNRNFCNRNIEIVVIIGVRRSLYVVLK